MMKEVLDNAEKDEKREKKEKEIQKLVKIEYKEVEILPINIVEIDPTTNTEIRSKKMGGWTPTMRKITDASPAEKTFLIEQKTNVT